MSSEVPAKPGYVVEGVVETSGPAAAPVAEVMPDWGTVLPAADVAGGKTVSVKCEQCHDLSKGGPQQDRSQSLRRGGSSARYPSRASIIPAP